MDFELPDLDEPISFAVDNGAQAGPFPMRSIIDSVRAGHRSPSTLIWWAGQPDWVPFESVPALMALLTPVAQPAPPGSTSLEAVSERIESLRPVGSDSTAVAEPTPEASRHEALFETVLERSASSDRRGWTQRLDLELRRALTGATLQQGHVLVELRSTGVSHLMVFEEPDGSRVTVGIEHLPPSSTASVSIGWGHRVADVSAAPQPGADAADIDTFVAAGYAYAVVDLIWEYDDYVAADQQVDRTKLVAAVEAAVHVLRSQWHQRFVEAPRRTD